MPHENNLQYQSDMIFGFSEEERIQPILEEHFGALKKLDKYNPFDFENDDYLIENLLSEKVVDVIEVVMNIRLWRI